MRVLLGSALLLVGVVGSCAALVQEGSGTKDQPGKAPAPVAAKKPVTDDFHGTKVAEDYRWLENWDDPKVKAWSEGQNEHARGVLDHLPAVDAIRERVTQVRSSMSPRYFALDMVGGRLIALKNQPPKQQPVLVVMPSADDPDKERVVVDPNVIDKEGHTAIDFFVPSHDGKLVAVSMSEGGSESGDVHVFDIASGKEVGEVVPRVNGGTAGGSLSWARDGKGFYYTRYPRGSERAPEDMDFYQQVYYHAIGTPTDSDRYEVGKEFPRIAEVMLETAREGPEYVLATVANGDGGQFEHFLRSPEGQWTQVTTFDDQCTHANLHGPDMLYLLTRHKSPLGELIWVPRADPKLVNRDEIILESPDKAVLEDWAVSGEGMFTLYQKGGISDLRLLDFRGSQNGFVKILPISSVGQIVRAEPGGVLFHNESYTEPMAWYHATDVDPSPRKTKLAQKPAVDFGDVEVVREVATSKDGTKVPITILKPRGIKLDGSNPTLIYGYGGYGVNQTPSYSEIRKVWLEQGGVWAITNIRGGAEFGEEWHRAGNLLNKQNVFDDFYACIRRMQELKYCTPEKTAIMGGSNGGLLMGAVMTQHPDAMAAVVSAVGIYDMLRVELSPNGAFNVTEFGTVKDPEQFKAMYAYSPYHHVKDGTKYPKVLFTTGANDPRVDPMQSRKMTARLQAAGCDALLRTSASSGHGIGSSLAQRIEEDVDRFAFLFDTLGVKYRPVAK
jgi:prolyl oligopeptidase